MKIHCLFAQRIESYEGQYAPELLDAIDEYTCEDNPDYLEDIKKEAEEEKVYSAVKVIDVEINDHQLEAQLFGKTLKGEIS